MTRYIRNGFLTGWLLASICVAGVIITPGCTTERPSGKSGAETAKTEPTQLLGTNPDFEAQADRGPRRPLGGELDRLLRPVLVKVFDGAKLLSDGGQSPFTMKYLVARRFAQKHGSQVQDALLKAGFEAKEGSGPTYLQARQTVEMTVRHELDGKPYNVSVILDLKNQLVYVNAWE